MWIFYSLVMFLASNIQYLAIRKAQKAGVAPSVYSIAMFAVPALTYATIAMMTQTSLLLSAYQYLIVLTTAFLWSYLGNFFSQRGMLLSPNPGYSLVLQKSYVVITTLAAVVLFGSSLSWGRIGAIVIILVSSAVISISKDTKRADLKWLLYSIGAHLCFAYGSLMSKYLLNLGLEPYQYLFYISSFVTTANILESRLKQESLALNKEHLGLLLLIGLGGVGFNLFMQFAYRVAPNPGYVVAFNTSSIMSVTVLAALLFKDSLSMQKVAGVVGVLVGLLLLTFS